MLNFAILYGCEFCGFGFCLVGVDALNKFNLRVSWAGLIGGGLVGWLGWGLVCLLGLWFR